MTRLLKLVVDMGPGLQPSEMLLSPDIGRMRFEAGVATFIGQRENNEDRSHLPARLTVGSVLAVADGMGGHADGEVAAANAVAAFADSEGDESLREVIERARRRVAAGEGKSTIVAAQIIGESEVEVRHMGDSRAYLYTPDARYPEENYVSNSPTSHLSQLTEDHTMVQGLHRRGAITAAEAKQHPDRNKVMRGLGFGDSREDVVRVEVKPGDVLLLCSDGVSNVIPRDKLEAVLAEASEGRILPQAAANKLIDMVQELRGRDNATALVVKIGELGKQADRRAGVERKPQERGIELGSGGGLVTVAGVMNVLVTPSGADGVEMAWIKRGQVRQAEKLSVSGGGVRIGRQMISRLFGEENRVISREQAVISMVDGRLIYDSRGPNPDDIIPIDVVGERAKRYEAGEIAVADLNRGRALLIAGDSRTWLELGRRGQAYFEWARQRQKLSADKVIEFGRDPGKTGVKFGEDDRWVSQSHGQILVHDGKAYIFVEGENGLIMRMQPNG